MLREILTANPGIRWEAALKELHRREVPPRDPDNTPRIERASEIEGVEWHEPGKIARDLPISKVKALFYKERDAIRKKT